MEAAVTMSTITVTRAAAAAGSERSDFNSVKIFHPQRASAHGQAPFRARNTWRDEIRRTRLRSTAPSYEPPELKPGEGTGGLLTSR